MAKEEKGPEKLKFHVFRDERFIDLNLYQFGWERTSPTHSYGPYARNHYLFHYIIEGRGQLMANGQEYTVTPGHGFLVVPGQVTTYRSDPADPWVYTWIEFDGLRAHESLHLAGISGTKPIYTARNAEAGKTVEDEMMYIVNHGSASPIHLIAHGFLFLDKLVQCSAGRRSGGERRVRDFYIKEALTFIEQNYQRDISIEEIAAAEGDAAVHRRDRRPGQLRQPAALFPGVQKRPRRFPPGVPLHPPDRPRKPGQKIKQGP